MHTRTGSARAGSKAKACKPQKMAADRNFSPEDHKAGRKKKTGPQASFTHDRTANEPETLIRTGRSSKQTGEIQRGRKLFPGTRGAYNPCDVVRSYYARRREEGRSADTAAPEPETPIRAGASEEHEPTCMDEAPQKVFF